MSISLTIVIVIVTSLISWQVMESRAKKGKLIFSPYLIQRNGEYYRFLSSGFIHANWIHLLFNMYVLYEFGENVEVVYRALFGQWGALLYLALYFGGIIVAHIPNFLWRKDDPGYGSLGASGAVSGIVFASIFFDPWGGIGLIFIPGFFIPGFAVGILYLVYSSWASKKRSDNIDHIAHFAGAVFGFFFTMILNPKLVSVFSECLIQGTRGCIYQYLM